MKLGTETELCMVRDECFGCASQDCKCDNRWRTC